MSSSTSTAPMVMAASATLNAQKCDVAPVDVDEVDDVAGHRAIDQVAERAAEDQRQAEARQPLVEARAASRRRRSRPARSPAMPIISTALNGKVRGVEQPERRAGVLDVRDVEEARDDRDVIVEIERPADDRLGELIERRRPRRW